MVRDGSDMGIHGASRMPAFGGMLSDDDITAVLAFIKSEWPPEIRAAQERLNRAARRSQ